ncbi:MAG: hypothetical protein ACQESR_25640 [Planctomycetota bacterium]
MHVRDLVELGASVAVHGASFVHHSERLTERHLQQYWLASRCRQDCWFRTLKAHEPGRSCQELRDGPRVRAVIEEVLASELLTRTWAAVGCSFDHRHATSHFAPVVRSVLISHMEARNRVLRAMMRGEQMGIPRCGELNRLRQKTERWTDKMLGYLARHFDVAEFAFDPDRACDFADDWNADPYGVPATDSAWALTFASLRNTYQQALSLTSPHPALNERIGGSILACFSSDLFSSADTLKSHWMIRLNTITEDAEKLVEELSWRAPDAGCGVSLR